MKVISDSKVFCYSMSTEDLSWRPVSVRTVTLCHMVPFFSTLCVEELKIFFQYFVLYHT